MLTVSQVAELCGVKPSTVRQWISRGKLKRTDTGHITNRELIEWWDDSRRHAMSRVACPQAPLVSHST